MQRSSLALLLVIALLSIPVARSLIFPSTPSVISSDALAEIETAQAFYAALNNALGGASTKPLTALLSPIFVAHVSDTGTIHSPDDFVGQVDAIGASSQGVRLEVISVEASGNNVIVGIRPLRDGALEVAGVTVRPTLPSPHYEVIRIERGKIVDRWAPAFSWLNASESNDSPLSMSSTSGIITTLVRVVLANSDEHAWPAMGLGMVIVETGSALLQVTQGNGAQAPVVLEQGTFTSIPNGARARLRSANGDPVSLTIYVATKIGPLSASLPAGDIIKAAPAASVKILWSGNHYWSQSATEHRPAQIVLPIGGVIELIRSPDSDLLLGGDSGMIEVQSASASVAVLGDDRWPMITEGVVQLDTSHAASISGKGIVSVRNLSDEPVTLVLISIEKAPIPDAA